MNLQSEHNKSDALKFWAGPLARPWKMFRQILSFSKLALQAAFIGSAMVLLLVPPSMMVYSVAPHRRLRYFAPFWRIFTKIVLRIGIWTKITSIDRRKFFNDPLGRGLYISNHQSMIDIPLLSEQHVVIPLMKKEVSEIPLFGKIIDCVGPISVDRSDPASRTRAFNQCVERLKNNWPVQYYPEGTRSKTGEPKPLSEIHTRLIEKAFELQTPVTPISIYGTYKILASNGDIRTGEHIGMITHEELWPKDFSSAQEFTAAVWENVVGGHKELKKMISRE